jgi:hypothetical protein
MPTTCQVRSEVVLSGKKIKKNKNLPPPQKKNKQQIELSGFFQLINMGHNIHL